MIDKRIIDFIKAHHLLTLATSKDNTPYCANCFYVYDEKKNWLIFSSDTKTRHAQDFIANPNVAGTIALETKEISKIQGVQLLGTILELREEELKIAKTKYLKAFPYAEKMKAQLWAMQLTFIKMTYNKLGFGKKLVWQK
jgi:hypothetical protein|tara:strand:+ start:792 stop:1211 length:420 start_codon:yes stop_codon:yes gene_type:complete